MEEIPTDKYELYKYFRNNPKRFALEYKDLNSRYYDGYLVYQIFPQHDCSGVPQPTMKLYCKIQVDRSDSKVTKSKFYYKY